VQEDQGTVVLTLRIYVIKEIQHTIFSL